MYECQRCDDTFWYLSEYEDHWPECETQHMNATGNHWAPRFDCDICSKDFGTARAAEQHMNATGHWQPKMACETCPAMFHTQSAADQHMAAMGHFEHYCKPCDRRFQSGNNLRMHLNSKTHQGTNVACPFCRVSYTTASGVVHHIETGSCPQAPQLNHGTILRLIRERDTHGLITNRSITWAPETNVKYAATEHAFNGYSWECYICHKEFNHIGGLNNHLNSPAHAAKVYRCPNRSQCGREFQTLAGLFNHLESESCHFMRFEKVQQQVGHVLGGQKLISFS